MEFRVLGPLDVRDDGRVVSLGGYRQRLVLAVLVANVDRELSADFLIDAVWGEDPPRTARKTLQVYVSRLRRLLGQEVIEATQYGYVLHVAPSDLDSLRFNDLASQGKRLLASDPPAAAGLLRQSLALWRGMPWGELGDESAIQPEAQRLRELRLSVLEDRISADLGSGRAPGLIGEVEGLVDEHPLRERFRFHLMLALYQSGRQADALRLFQETCRILGEELGIEPSRELQDLEEKILLQDPSIDGPVPATPVEDWTMARNPYKGLRTFAAQDAEDFFGRDGLVEELLGRIRTQSLVAVVGASGSGKSSAILAGLLPRLQPSETRGAENWLVATMVPGRHPFEELAAAVDRSMPGQTTSSTPSEPADSFTLLRVIQNVVGDDMVRVLLVIDQFEELFHQVADETERARFVRNLAEAVEDPHSQLTVLITMRADFFDRAISEASLGPLIDAGQANVLPLVPAELEAAAARPAERVGVHIEPELIAELVSDMTGQPGSLPLFQYVLTQLFDERAGMVLTRSAYRRIGGLRGALARRAEQVYQTLDKDHQAAARQLLLRFLTVDEDHGQSRRRVTRDELESLALDPDTVDVVLDTFDDARLLTFDRSPVSGKATVEVAHEAVLREWPRLSNWLEENREELRLQRILTNQAGEWVASGHDPDYLLAGSRLELHAAGMDDGVLEPTKPEREFLEASVGRRDNQLAFEEERRQQELKVERRAVRRLRWLVAVASVAALVATALTVFATNQSREAAASQREARARELANASLANLETNPELAILLALQSLGVGSVDAAVLRDATEALHLAIPAYRLLGEAVGKNSVDFHPGGSLFIGGNPARLINPVTGEVRLQLPAQLPGWTIQSVTVNSTGSLLATGTNRQGELIVWDTVSGAEVVELTGPSDSIATMAFSPDGQSLAALSPWGGGVFVWDVESGDTLVVADDPSAWGVCCPPVAITFSPDGSRVAVTTSSGAATLQGEVKLLDLATGRWVGALVGHKGPITGVEYVPGQETILTSSMDGTIRMWNATTGAQVISTNAGIGQVTSIDLSEDGQVLLAGGDGGIVKVWAVGDDLIEPRVSLPGHPSFILQVALDPAGEVGASIAVDQSVRVWDVTALGRGEVAAWSADRPVAFVQDGKRIATTGPAGRDIVIRQTSDWQPLVVLEDVVPYVGDPNEEWGVVSGISFSPDGTQLLTTTGSRLEAVNGTVTLWDAAAGVPIRTFLEHPYMKGPAAWSGDGRRVAVATCDTLGAPARVWDSASGALLFTAPPVRCGQTVDLDHTGRLLAVQTLLADEPNIHVWDVESGELVLAVTHRPQWIGGVAFNPDSTRLLTGGGDGAALIWEVPTGDLVRVLSGHTGSVEDVAWSSDGSTAITGSHDGTVRLWNAATGETLLILGGHGTFPVVGISPDGRYLASGVSTGIQVWALEIEELKEIARTRVQRPLTEAECVSYHFESCPTTP